MFAKVVIFPLDLNSQIIDFLISKSKLLLKRIPRPALLLEKELKRLL